MTIELWGGPQNSNASLARREFEVAEPLNVLVKTIVSTFITPIPSRDLQLIIPLQANLGSVPYYTFVPDSDIPVFDYYYLRITDSTSEGVGFSPTFFITGLGQILLTSEVYNVTVGEPFNVTWSGQRGLANLQLLDGVPVGDGIEEGPMIMIFPEGKLTTTD